MRVQRAWIDRNRGKGTRITEERKKKRLCLFVFCPSRENKRGMMMVAFVAPQNEPQAKWYLRLCLITLICSRRISGSSISKGELIEIGRGRKDKALPEEKKEQKRRRRFCFFQMNHKRSSASLVLIQSDSLHRSEREQDLNAHKKTRRKRAL